MAAIVTDLWLAALTKLFATRIHQGHGLLAILLVGSVPAVIVGAMLSARLPHTLLHNVLALVLFAIGLKPLFI